MTKIRGQLPAADARSLAESHGIAYHHIPVNRRDPVAR